MKPFQWEMNRFMRIDGSTEGHTDMAKLTVTFRSPTNVHEK